MAIIGENTTKGKPVSGFAFGCTQHLPNQGELDWRSVELGTMQFVRFEGVSPFTGWNWEQDVLVVAVRYDFYTQNGEQAVLDAWHAAIVRGLAEFGMGPAFVPERRMWVTTDRAGLPELIIAQA